MSSSIDSNHLVLNTNHRKQGASLCSTRFVEGFILILYRWQSPEWSQFFFSGQRPKREEERERESAHGREVEYIHTYMSRVREEELLRNHPRRMIDSRVFTTYILHNIVQHIQLIRWGFNRHTSRVNKWEKIDSTLETATRILYCTYDCPKAIYRWETDMNL